ncbi:MAG: hypothetical protein AAF587_45080 [Bacteroidota bacterium]
MTIPDAWEIARVLVADKKADNPENLPPPLDEQVKDIIPGQAIHEEDHNTLSGVDPDIIEQVQVMEDTLKVVSKECQPTPDAQSEVSQGSWCGSMAHAFAHISNTLIHIPDVFNFGDYEYCILKEFNLTSIHAVFHMNLRTMINSYDPVTL